MAPAVCEREKRKIAFILEMDATARKIISFSLFGREWQEENGSEISKAQISNGIFLSPSTQRRMNEKRRKPCKQL